MADRLDKVLSSYFKGFIDNEIQDRLRTIKYNNIVNGRSENHGIERDLELMRLNNTKDMIGQWLTAMFGEDMQKAIRAHYLGMRYVDIQCEFFLSKTTVIKAIKELKNVLGVKL